MHSHLSSPTRRVAARRGQCLTNSYKCTVGKLSDKPMGADLSKLRTRQPDVLADAEPVGEKDAKVETESTGSQDNGVNKTSEAASDVQSQPSHLDADKDEEAEAEAATTDAQELAADAESLPVEYQDESSDTAAPTTTPDVQLVQAYAEQPMPSSLATQRERVQRLRFSLPSTSDDTDIRAQLASAGMPDERDAPVAEQADSSSDSDSSEHVVVVDLEEPDASETPKTKHEVVDEAILLPAISQISPEEQSLLQHIGQIHSIVDSVVLVEQTPGPLQATAPHIREPFDVLDSESMLCTAEGRVIGLVYETFGSVQAPMYSIRFPSADTIDRDLITPGVPVFFLPASSTYVLARSIRNKGSDASNIWDEEVEVDEAEYSDDDEEAAAKRRAKQERRVRAEGSDVPRSPAPEMDPLEASLGPLGGYPARTASHRGKRKEKARNDRAPPSDAPGRKRGRAHGFGQAPSAPHINPRFAGPWMQPGGYGMPMGMPTPPFPFGTSNEGYRPEAPGHAFTPYSPNHTSMPAPEGSYDPTAYALPGRPPNFPHRPYTP